ncbi:MAG: histidine kinase, partial [Oscillospiraceae bacterium]|nr:histidine kinase [Oscillospiraceae bacterium]
MTKKIFLNTFLVGMAVLILCSAMFFGLQYRQNVDGTYNNLKENSAYVANGIAISGEDYLKTIDGSLGITWIDENGTVLFDSSGDSGPADPMDLPEVRDAFGAAGEGMRETDSKGVTAVCYAVRLDDGTVLRLSDTSGAAMAALKAVSPVLWVFVLVLLLSLILAFRVAKDILRPVNSLDLDAPDVSSTYPELAPLVERIQEQNLTIRDQMNELYSRQKEFSALTDSMSEGFVLIDMRGSILSANSSALSLMDNAEIGGDLFKYTDDEIG